MQAGTAICHALRNFYHFKLSIEIQGCLGAPSEWPVVCSRLVVEVRGVSRGVWLAKVLMSVATSNIFAALDTKKKKKSSKHAKDTADKKKKDKEPEKSGPPCLSNFPQFCLRVSLYKSHPIWLFFVRNPICWDLICMGSSHHEIINRGLIYIKIISILMDWQAKSSDGARSCMAFVSSHVLTLLWSPRSISPDLQIAYLWGWVDTCICADHSIWEADLHEFYLHESASIVASFLSITCIWLSVYMGLNLHEVQLWASMLSLLC